MNRQAIQKVSFWCVLYTDCPTLINSRPSVHLPLCCSPSDLADVVPSFESQLANASTAADELDYDKLKTALGL